MAIDDVLRRKDHTGTESEERIIAEAGLMAESPGAIYTVFSNADFPFAEVTLSDGKTVKLDRAAFPLYRTAARSRGPEEGVRRILRKDARLPPHDRHAAVQRSEEESLLSACAEVSDLPAQRPAREQHSGRGLSRPHRQCAQCLPGVPQVSRSAPPPARAWSKLHYYDLYAHVVPDVTLAVHLRGSA